MVRNTKAFKEAVAETLAELARRGVTLTPATVEDTIERNVQAVADQLVGRAVVVLGHRAVVINVDLGLGPGGELVAHGGQWLERDGP